MTARRGPARLHPRWSWPVGRAWLITALSASVTLILGAVLGALPALLAGSWQYPQTRDQTWVLIGFAAARRESAPPAVPLPCRAGGARPTAGPATSSPSHDSGALTSSATPTQCR